VVLAVPGPPAARLLAGVVPDASAAVAVLDYASVALVTLLLPGVALPALSGLLVPPRRGFAAKAVTFRSRKWPHLPDRDDGALVRASVGRHGEPADVQRPDPELTERVHRDIGELLGRGLPAPVASVVTRWGGALPQYAVGHLDRVAAVRSVLPPGLALAGAAFDGVGIAACVRSGEAAAESVWGQLRQLPP
jgi:oxygen-dependent protoporphyrinogen oxidase